MMKHFELTVFTGKGDRRELNPYLRVGGFELCIDRHGFAVHLPSGGFGFIRGAGFWSSRTTPRLFAAAPALLASLVEVMDAMDDGSDEPALIRARAAIASAQVPE